MFINVEDAEMPDTYLSRRSYSLEAGKEDNIFIQLPLTRKNILVTIFENAADKDAIPESFTVHLNKVKLMSLPSQMKIFNIKDSKLREWIRLAQQFCYNAAVLPCLEDKFYVSDNGNFKIKYVERIIDENGQENVTPMRINQFTHIIEASKQKLLPMTVPGRYYIANHEYSHLNMNEDVENELEADLNGLMIGLATGFPKYEARQVFLNTFLQDKVKDNPEVQQRMYHIENFIDEYENLEFEHL